MKSLGGLRFVVLSMLAVGASVGGELPNNGQSPSCTLVGQLLLPSGSGSRGVEVVVRIDASDGEPNRIWVLFDEHGYFSHTFDECPLTSLTVTAGIGREVHRIEAEALRTVANQVDVGEIDLRDRLADHRLTVRAAAGKPSGDVRVAMWFGPPPVGPMGEPVSLGSRQFPPVALGTELEWLLPHEAQDVYFLVERPAGSGRGTNWRSGHQRLFGPFTAAEFPAELIMD